MHLFAMRRISLLLGLDAVKKFGLTHDGNLNIHLHSSANPNACKKIDSNIKRDDSIHEDEAKLKHEIHFKEGIDMSEYKMDTNYLDANQVKKIGVLLNDYKDIFAKDKYDVGKVKIYEAFIDLKEEKYCSKRPYRCSLDDKDEIEGQIYQLLKHGLIEESYSPFAAPVTLAFKENEEKKTRLCIDFRDLNKIIVPQSQPFPLIEDLIVKTIDCKFFTTLDINSAFWSIPLKKSDRRKTGFVTQEGHYQWKRLPFGLKTSPAVFQRILANVIRKFGLSKCVINYLDDIMIFSRSFGDHMDILSKLLKALAEEGFRLNLKKCKFAAQSAKYLGHIITNSTIKQK